MKNILWLFLFSMLMSPESFGTLASSESDIQTLLSAGRSSFIAGKIREVLRSRLDSGPLTSDKIRKLIQSPQVAALCCLHQFFNTAEGGKPFTQEELKDQIFRKWLSSHPEVFNMLAQSGPAGKSTLSVFYQIWNTNDQNFNPAELSMALGAGLVANIFSPEECIAKFNFYRDSHHHARCYPQAETLQPWEWAIVFRGKEGLEDLAWAQQFIAGKKIRPEKAGSRFPGFIPYRKKMKKISASITEALFRTTSPTRRNLTRNTEEYAAPSPKARLDSCVPKEFPLTRLDSRGTAPSYGNTPMATGKSATISAAGIGPAAALRFLGKALFNW